MLDLGIPTETVGEVVLGRDDVDDRLWYAFPGVPRVVRRDGAAQVDLLRFVRDGALMGGHLRLSVDLAHPPQRLEQAQALLRDVHKDPKIIVSALPVRDAQAALLFAGSETDADGGVTSLVTHLYGNCQPKLDAPHTAHFGADLTPDGVRVLEAALRSSGTPAVVTFRLQVEGLQPAQRVVARVDWSRVYDHLSAQLREGYLLVTEDLQRIAESLIERKVISLSVVQPLAQVAGEDPTNATVTTDTTAAALAWIQREIVERFCDPVLALSRNAASASVGGIAELLGIGGAYAVRKITQIERATAEVDLQRSAAVCRTLTLSAQLSDLLQGDPPDAHIADAGLDHPFFARIALRVRTAKPLSASMAQEVVGEFSYGSTRSAFRLSASEGEATLEAWADAAQDRTWTLGLSCTLSHDAPIDPGQRIQLPTLKGQSSELTLNLDRLLGYRRVEVSVPPDPERVLASRVELRQLRRTEQIAQQELLLSPQTPQQVAWFRDVQPDDRIEAKAQHLLRSGRRVDGPPLVVDTQVFRLPPVFAGILTVQLFGDGDFSELDQVLVSIQKAADQPVATFRFDKSGAMAAVNLDLPDPSDRNFRYRVVRMFKSGQVEEDDWIDSDIPVVLVGKVAANKLVVDIQPVGPELPSAGVVLIEVELSYIDAANQLREQTLVLIRAVADRPRWEVAIRDPHARSYEYRVTVHRTSGAKHVGPWTRTSDRLLLIPITSG